MRVLLLERFDFMKDEDIRKYATLMKEFGLTGFEITDEHSKIRLECAVSDPKISQVPTVSTVSTVSTEKSTAADTADYAADYVSVKSPIVGVFYSAPAENADPYVVVGESVKAGQTLCVVEAMKLMNEITAETDGVIAEVCVTNGQVVDYGTELFRIKK